MRVLRGIGGEQVFLARYRSRSEEVRLAGVRVALPQSTLDSAQVLLPGIFVVIVTWLGARLAVEGTISAGELVAFYGYAAFLVIPLRTAAETVDKVTRAYVGANRMLEILRIEPQVAEPSAPAVEPPPGLPLTDRRSGFVVEPGLLTCVVSAVPQEGVELVDRLGRFVHDDGVLLGGVSLESLPVEAVRRRIVVSETDPMLFSGPLQEELDPWARATEAQVLAAIAVANAEDVLDSLPEGLAGLVEERGRSLSGGQRQRLVLARALLSDAEILLLVDPTSAVDAHTEARIARRLLEARRGRTTVILTGSPLVLDQAERVVFLEDGVVAAIGTHRELLQSSPAYRWTVTREEASERACSRSPTGPRFARTRPRSSGGTGAPVIFVLGLHGLAAVAGLAGPRLLGGLVQAVEDGTTTSHIDSVVGLLAGFVLAQTILTWFARRASFVLSEQVFARLREDFMSRVLALPLSTVERAGTGDLVSRTTADVDSLARTVRFAIPETMIAAVTAC